MTTNRPEFKAHDDFIFEHKKIGKVTREEFIKYIRSSHDHMRKLSQIIQQYNQTIDDYLNEWDGQFESFDEDVKDLLGRWINDGTMDQIINENLMSNKADKTYVDELHDSTTAQLAQNVNQLIKTGINLTAKARKEGTTILFTGDSLSYSRHDFESQGVSNEATGVFPGIMPWSFMLRDALYRDDEYWVSAEELNLTVVNGRGTQHTQYNILGKYSTQFNNRYSQTSCVPETEISFSLKRNPLSNKVILYVMPVSTGDNVSLSTDYSVYINDILVAEDLNNLKDYSIFKGYETDIIELEIPSSVTANDITITIKDFKSPLPIFRLYGVGTRKRNILNTGRGGWRSSNFLADIQNRILQHNPDILFLILGANDIVGGITPQEYKSNMLNIVNQVKAQDNPCEVVLLTLPPLRNEANPSLNDSLYKPDNVVVPYIRALYEVALETNSEFINLFNLFTNEKISDWRFDNVHFTKYGNNVLANHIVNKYFVNLIGDKNLFDANNSYGSGKRYKL